MPRKLTKGRGARADAIAKAIGIAIKEARASAGLSQAALAAQVGISRQLFTDIEAGRVSPRVDQVDAIATACGVSPTTITRRSVDLVTV
jgi:transcriptional regulator with XRE-family HTH domain